MIINAEALKAQLMAQNKQSGTSTSDTPRSGQYKAWQRRGLSVRPGLTCYWQVGGRNAIGFDEWMRLDLRYVDNWSLAVDMQLIIQTFPAVLAGRGAS